MKTTSVIDNIYCINLSCHKMLPFTICSYSVKPDTSLSVRNLNPCSIMALLYETVLYITYHELHKFETVLLFSADWNALICQITRGMKS